MPTSNDCFDYLTKRMNYPEDVARDLCNFFDSAKLVEFCESLAEQNDDTVPWDNDDE